LAPARAREDTAGPVPGACHARRPCKRQPTSQASRRKAEAEEEATGGPAGEVGERSGDGGAAVEAARRRRERRPYARGRGEGEGACAAGRGEQEFGGGGCLWVPRYRGWRSGSLYRGDGEGFLVHEEKRVAYWGSAGDGFIPYMATFLVLGRG
jgi:hypothetical protein